MVAVDGLLDPEAGQTLMSALEPLARPTAPPMGAVVAGGGPMPRGELARRSLDGRAAAPGR
jgi:hypothetical protein